MLGTHTYIHTCGSWPRDHKKTHAMLLNYDVPQVEYVQSVFNLKHVQLTMSPDHDRIYKAELQHKSKRICAPQKKIIVGTPAEQKFSPCAPIPHDPNTTFMDVPWG